MGKGVVINQLDNGIDFLILFFDIINLTGNNYSADYKSIDCFIAILCNFIVKFDGVDITVLSRDYEYKVRIIRNTVWFYFLLEYPLRSILKLNA